MTDVPHWQLDPVVGRAELGPLGPPVSENTGQSLAIRPLADHPGWLAKLYRQPRPPQDDQRLDGLVAAPAALDGQDRATLLSGSCWPVARITEPSGSAVGCVLPAAPDRFQAVFTVGGNAVPRYVEVDWLAKTDAAMGRVGLTTPGEAGRITACRNLAALAEVLEKLGLVYSDWSYSNAFWSPADKSVFVIDVDGCQAGKMPNLRQPNWTDPLTGPGGDADRYTDRFRVALLIARCLTAKRGADAVEAVAAGGWSSHPALRDVLLDMLLAADRERRPAIRQLRLALDGGPYFRPQPRPVWLAVPGSATVTPGRPVPSGTPEAASKPVRPASVEPESTAADRTPTGPCIKALVRRTAEAALALALLVGMYLIFLILDKH